MKAFHLISGAVVALAAALVAAGSANATISIGDTLDLQYDFPDSGTVYSDSGDFAYTGPGQTVFSAYITAVVLGGDTVVFANNQASLDGVEFSGGSFNGPVLIDVTNSSAFAGWSVTSATAAYTSILLTDSAIGVNFSDQIYNGGEVAFAGVPEQNTWATMAIGVGAIGAGMRLARRRDRIAPTAA